MNNKPKISLSQLEKFLDKAAVVLRGSMEASEYKEFIFGMLFIKRMSDEFEKKREELRAYYLKQGHTEKVIEEFLEDKNSYGDTFFVPKRARWNEGFTDENGEPQPAIKDLKDNIGESLNKAIAAIEEENDVLSGVLKGNIDFNKTTGKNNRIKDGTWKELIDHFNNPEFILTNDNFEFPDLLGAAYEYLIKFFADSAGKKAGEFYTPYEVVRLLVQIIKPKPGMEVYDPTVGSGGMLIQSGQYIEEQGEDQRKIALYGQEKAGTVWSICMMNMILHNRPDAHIENGDTIEDPIHKEGGSIKKFDRVIANPPFSQNYIRANVKFDSRFKYGWAPESGKKADLMFVQHMIASLKPKGMMATIMPHGVLFRGGQEKLIREEIVNDNIIEAIIGLPPSLFYGTGIPACVLVINRNKPDSLKDKIFFINADAEFAEGKNQNKLRPEDIEKIDYVLTNKIEIPKYSKLVSKTKKDEKDTEFTIEGNDYNLNIRRYVDNTPEPEPQDVKSHLIGGVPKSEVSAKIDIYKKFGFDSSMFFTDKNKNYFLYKKEFADKDKIKGKVEEDAAVKKTTEKMHSVIDVWWATAKKDFSKIALGLSNGVKMADIRHELITSLKEDLTKVGVLDEFQSAGVFVNWWNNIKYDLKTISSSGWSAALIPDELMAETFFKKEQAEIEKLETDISEEENLLSEAMETVEYEPDEDEKVTAKLLIDSIDKQIEGLSESKKESAKKESQNLQQQLDDLKKHDSAVKKYKKLLKTKQEELEYKIFLKRNGSEGSKIIFRNLKTQAKQQIKSLELTQETDAKEEKKRLKKINTLSTDIETIDGKINDIDTQLKSIGGMITSDKSKELILKKHFNLISDELNRYLIQEKRKLMRIFENLWEKYADPQEKLEQGRNQVINELNENLKRLKYYD